MCLCLLLLRSIFNFSFDFMVNHRLLSDWSIKPRKLQLFFVLDVEHAFWDLIWLTDVL